MDTLKTIKKKQIPLEGRKCFEILENVNGNCGYRLVMQFVMLLDNFV